LPALPTQPSTPATSPQVSATSSSNSTPASVSADDRYGSAPASSTPTSPITPMPTSNAMPAGGTLPARCLAVPGPPDRSDLKQAHQLLSKWHGNEALSPAESQQVESLLSQLAGTLIYSTDTRLEPGRVVKQNETLEVIAKEYNVPWQLLAKINGISAPD